MDRRLFLQGLAALGTMSPLGALGGEAAAVPQAQSAPSWTLGFQSMNSDQLRTASLTIEGALPKALRGALYRNGAARHERAGMRYHHWFDGDGMIQAYRFTDQGVSHQAQFVHTEKYLAEQKAGRFQRAAFGTVFPGMEPVDSADSINAANISVLYHADELLALWEGGSAHRIDAGTLETKGRKTWRADLAGMPFSAHPKIDADGTLWNFGTVGNQNLLVLYRISATGEIRKVDAITVPQLPMIHDFAITERHLVFLLPPFRVDPKRLAGGNSIADSYVWDRKGSMRVLTIDKDDWSKQRYYEVESGFVFHFGNAWEDRQGVIRLSYLRADDDAPFRKGFDVMRGVYKHVPGARLSLMKIDPGSGQVTQEHMPEQAEFPSIDPRHVGRRYRHIVTLARSTTLSRPGYDQVQRRDLESGTIDRYAYGADIIPEEHLLVPDLSSRLEGAGWIIGTALDLKKKTTMLSVFDSMALRDGPLMQAQLPYAMPLGLHGTFQRQTRLSTRSQ